MRARLMTGSWWQIALVEGILFGVLMSGLRWVTDPDEDRDVLSFLITALIAAAFFGPLMARQIVRMRERTMAAVGVDTVEDLAAVTRAARREAEPVAPELRSPARKLLEYRVQEARRQGPAGVALFGVLALLGVLGAFLWSPWWLAVAALCAGFAVYTWMQPRLLERRLQAFSGADVGAGRDDG